jgi:hypothetical protein
MTFRFEDRKSPLYGLRFNEFQDLPSPVKKKLLRLNGQNSRSQAHWGQAK